jgi:hypothetical protein
MIVNGYQCTLFQYNNLKIKLKIPDFQLNKIFTKNELKQPILIDKLYNGLQGVICLEALGKVYLLPLTPTKNDQGLTKYFHCNKSGVEYLLAWWEWYKPKRADEIISLIKQKKETITSIALNEESIFLQTPPLSTFIKSKAFIKHINDESKYFGNKEYQGYMEYIHYIKHYGQRKIIEKKHNFLSSDLLKESDQNKFYKYPRLYKSVNHKFNDNQASKLKSPVLAFTNFGIYEQDFIEYKLSESEKLNKKDQIQLEEGKNRITPVQNTIFKKAIKENLTQHYSKRPITLIVDLIIIEQ